MSARKEDVSVWNGSVALGMSSRFPFCSCFQLRLPLCPRALYLL